MGLEPKGALDPYSQPLLIKIFRKTYSNQMIQIFLAFKMKITTAFSLHASSTRGSCKRATGGHQSFHKVAFQSLNPRDAPGTNVSHGHGGVSAMTGALPVRVTCTMAPLPPKSYLLTQPDSIQHSWLGQGKLPREYHWKITQHTLQDQGSQARHLKKSTVGSPFLGKYVFPLTEKKKPPVSEQIQG